MCAAAQTEHRTEWDFIGAALEQGLAQEHCLQGSLREVEKGSYVSSCFAFWNPFPLFSSSPLWRGNGLEPWTAGASRTELHMYTFWVMFLQHVIQPCVLT